MSKYLWDIHRVDDDTVWTVGDNGFILRSTDGGQTWVNKSKPEFEEVDFRGGYFEDAHSGWVVGKGGRVLFTTDGGTTWTQQEQVVYGTLYGIDFVDSNNGWAGGDNGAILHTTNRGTNWTSQSSGTTSPFRSLDFVDSLNGWAVGDNGWAVYTNDGGTNWTQKSLSTSTLLNNIDFVDSLHGWIVGWDGTILSTSDLGANWVSHSSGSYYMYGIAFADTLTGWATGYSEIIKTTDRGQSWSSQYKNVEPVDLVNLVAAVEGSSFPGREVLMTGHYDDASQDEYNWAPGADDNASGTVSLLAAASAVKDHHLANTVKFIAFSGEEQGLLGSYAYAEEAYDRGDTILGVFNFDMIAYDGNGDGVMEVHCGYPPENQALGDLLIGAISDYGLSLSPQKLIGGASQASDHASFWAYNFPAIAGGEDHDDFNPYYHTTGDRVSAFDTSYYVDFARAAVAVTSILGDPFIIGDANEDAVVDIVDGVFLVNYVLRSGPSPELIQAGDVNCDDVVDLGDVVYLVNYLFRNGPPPC